MNRCLGKLPARHDPRTSHLRAVLTPSDVPTAPPMRDWLSKLPTDLGMLANDRVGDCTCVSAAHMIAAWTSQSTGLIQMPSEQEVLAAYAAVSGWRQSDPSSDQGANMLDVLNYWRQTGIGGHKIGAYVKVNHADVAELQLAVELFGGLYVGSNLPVNAKDTTQPWTQTRDPAGGWGGHCMSVGGYDRTYATLVTWGKRQPASWPWFCTYVDECYAVLSGDWIDGTGHAPDGLDVDKLKEMLAAVAA